MRRILQSRPRAANRCWHMRQIQDDQSIFVVGLALDAHALPATARGNVGIIHADECCPVLDANVAGLGSYLTADIVNVPFRWVVVLTGSFSHPTSLPEGTYSEESELVKECVARAVVVKQAVCCRG